MQLRALDGCGVDRQAGEVGCEGQECEIPLSSTFNPPLIMTLPMSLCRRISIFSSPAPAAPAAPLPLPLPSPFMRAAAESAAAAPPSSPRALRVLVCSLVGLCDAKAAVPPLLRTPATPPCTGAFFSSDDIVSCSARGVKSSFWDGRCRIALTLAMIRAFARIPEALRERSVTSIWVRCPPPPPAEGKISNVMKHPSHSAKGELACRGQSALRAVAYLLLGRLRCSI